MHFGVSMFRTDYSRSAVDLARALPHRECRRGFSSRSILVRCQRVVHRVSRTRALELTTCDFAGFARPIHEPS